MKSMAAAVYLRKGTFVVCSCSYTTDGVGIESGPVFVAGPDSPATVLGELARKAIAASKTGVSHPSGQSEWATVANVVPNAFGLKSRRALMEGNPRYCDVDQRDDIVTLTPSKRSDDGEGFDFLPDSKLTLPANSSLGAIGEAIMEALRRSQ